MRVPPFRVWGTELAGLVAAALVGLMFGWVWPWEVLELPRIYLAAGWGALAAGILARLRRPAGSPRSWAAAEAALLTASCASAIVHRAPVAAVIAAPVVLVAAGLGALVASLPLPRRAGVGLVGALGLALLAYGFHFRIAGECARDADCPAPRRCLAFGAAYGGVRFWEEFHLCGVPCDSDADCAAPARCRVDGHGDPPYCERPWR